MATGLEGLSDIIVQYVVEHHVRKFFCQQPLARVHALDQGLLQARLESFFFDESEECEQNNADPRNDVGARLESVDVEPQKGPRA